MRPTRIPVAVEFEKVAVRSQWADARWQLSRVELVDGDPDRADESAVERIDAAGVLERWRYPGLETEMHPTEGEGYWLNLNSPDPRAFVMWRMREGDGEPAIVPVIVTLSYNRAASMMDGGEQVDSVPLDPRIRAMLEPYTAEHYKPEARRKNKRNDPFVDGAFVRDRDRERDGGGSAG